MQTLTHDRVEDALRQVIDPELGLNVVDLGLIYEIHIIDDEVRVVMTMTTAGCPVQGYLQESVRAAAASVPGVKKAFVQVVWDPAWSPEFITEAGRRHFGWV